MGRKVSTSGGLVRIEDATIDRMVARGVSKVAPLATQWAMGGALVPAGALTHHLWGAPGVLPWVTAGLTMAGTALTALTWAVSHARGKLGRGHSTVTTAAASAWITAATITGATASPTLDVGLLVGGGLTLAWNIRTVIRPDVEDGDGAGRGLKVVFGNAADKAGLKGTVLKEIDRQPRRVTATAQMEGGTTADDLQKRIAAIESAMGLPPGSMTATADEDDASAAKVTWSNPALMREPIPYEGPSRPGASMGDPIRVGVHQDGLDGQWVILNHHTQVMGKTGVAKSFGGFWNFAGEVMTRHDGALFVADLDKGEQTVGPMRPGLHRVELDLPGAKRLLAQFYAVVRPRTDYLAAKGLKEWEPGCGLTFLVLWLEEFPTLGDELEMKEFMRFMRTARSAGIHVVLSLQRSDWTQMPTFVRGQLANWCFGVANSQDAAFGLSEAQQEAGARPELWASRPGLSVIDVPGGDQDRIAMPLRTPMWTTEQMREHAESFHAVGRPLDPITAKYLQAGPGGWAAPPATASSSAGAASAAAIETTDPSTDDEVTNVANEYARTPDPDPAAAADIDTPIEPAAGEWTFKDDKDRMPPEQAQRVLADAIEGLRRAGRESFAPRDLAEVLTRTGCGRTWIQKRLSILVDAGELEHDKATGTYMFVRALQPA
ncbi:hypothetical protein [Actinomadura sp. 21ATH]|uniref:hypothetical protein n=1 Tax=Actinomadura sp. 21ATH TaxID=1735444 RepID=UPI0035C1A921